MGAFPGMLAVLSPSKTFDFETPVPELETTLPDHIAESQKLVAVLRKQSAPALARLMKISPALAQLNHRRYEDWEFPWSDQASRPAFFAFKGEVYTGIDLSAYRSADFRYAQKHLRILSGLYGLLRPLDEILPYRLEMGCPLKVGSFKNLYQFWGDQLTRDLSAAVAATKPKVLINLASKEYFEAIRPDGLGLPVITPHFQEWKNGRYQFISVFGKRARGLMADYLIRERISNPDDLKRFDSEGYRHDPERSDEQNWYFTRGRCA